MLSKHWSWVLGWFVFLFFVLVIPVPPSASTADECYSTTGLEGHVGPHSYVDGRAFFGTYQNRAAAVVAAQRLGACVENFGITVHHVEPLQKWALSWGRVRGFSVWGANVKREDDDFFRIVWVEKETGMIHYSPWYHHGVFYANRDIPYLNMQYGDHFIFWVELAL